MKRIIFMTLAIVISLLLSSCEKSAKETTEDYILPDGLKDCKIFDLRDASGSYLRVVRCPLSNASAQYRSGKITYSSHVVETNAMPESEKVEPSVPETVQVNGVTYVKAK